jgi:hypothetical protein
MDATIQSRTIEVSVNRQTVHLPEREVTGLEIKKAAIGQGVEIAANFQLSVERGGHLQVVGDADEIRVHEHEKFICVAPDDNS